MARNSRAWSLPHAPTKIRRSPEERGAFALPPVFLPLLARLLDLLVGTVLANIHAAPETLAELHTLVTAFNAIPTRMARDAMLTLALSYSASPG